MKPRRLQTLAAAFVLAACSTSGGGATSHGSLHPTTTTAPVWRIAAPRHAGMQLRYPPWLHVSTKHLHGTSMTTTLFTLSNQRLINPCTVIHTATVDGLRCRPWPVQHLATGGVVANVERDSFPDPDFIDRLPGRQLTIDGHQAKLAITPADQQCRTIGGLRSLDGVIRDHGFIAFSFVACLATTQPEVIKHIVASFRSITFTS